MVTMLMSRCAQAFPATVSRVLNGIGQVKESTREQVFNAMGEQVIAPIFWRDPFANRSSNSVGLVVSTFDGFYFCH